MPSSSDQFCQGVYEFQMEVFKMMLEKFDGKVVGSDDFNLERLKGTFFEGYNPGQNVKPKQAAKPKKQAAGPKPLSGYQFFGKTNKDSFNEEMSKMDEKPKYVTFVGQKWKKLEKEEQEEWTQKAIDDFEAIYNTQ